jgi:hypothetical protein
MSFDARLYMYHHGQMRPLKDAEVVADMLTDIHNVMVKCLFVVKRRCIHERFLGVCTGKNPENSNLARVGIVQCVILYLSFGHGG